MRDAFFSELLPVFKHDPRVVFLTGDLGYKLFDELTAHDPARVINCGIREAGMVGYAAGLAQTGLRPFVYSIAPFATLRCLEQIKIDLCYNRANVVVVGVGGGVRLRPQRLDPPRCRRHRRTEHPPRPDHLDSVRPARG